VLSEFGLLSARRVAVEPVMAFAVNVATDGGAAVVKDCTVPNATPADVETNAQ
jgi:hypothetical protein